MRINSAARERKTIFAFNGSGMMRGPQYGAVSTNGVEYGSGARLACTIALLVMSILLATCRASAGELDRASIAKYYPEPYLVGERDADLPIWPLFRHAIPASDELLGYVFETIDLAPIAGYAGTPPNLLVAISPDGTFLGVNVISHKEPIFQHGVSEDFLSISPSSITDCPSNSPSSSHLRTWPGRPRPELSISTAYPAPRSRCAS